MRTHPNIGKLRELLVVQAFFAAIRPAQLDALEAVLAAQNVECQHLVRQWDDRLQRARYAAHLAERQYNAVDPENRLVAGELERRWEEKLHQLQEIQEAHQRFQQTSAPTKLAPELRERFRHISETLPELWPELANGQKKELLRSLIARVVLNRPAPDRVEVKVVYISGHYTVACAQPPVAHQEDVTGFEEMVERIRVLWQEGLADEQIAARLTEEGFHTARSAQVAISSVAKIRRGHGWHLTLAQSRNTDELHGYLTVRGLATRVGVDRSWVYRRIYDGTVDPQYVMRHPQSQVYMIKDNPEVVETLQECLTRKPHNSRRHSHG